LTDIYSDKRCSSGESAGHHQRAQTGKILVKAIEQPKPVLLVVDLDPLERNSDGRSA